MRFKHLADKLCILVPVLLQNFMLIHKKGFVEMAQQRNGYVCSAVDNPCSITSHLVK